MPAGPGQAFLAIASAAWLCILSKHLVASTGPGELGGKTIGIDVGTYHTRVAVFEGGKVAVLKNEQGIELTPSYVAFTASGQRLIGDEAKSQLTTDPQNTVFSVLPLLGSKFDDAEVQKHIKQLPYRVYSRENLPAIEVTPGSNTESFTPEEIVAMLLRKMKEIAERHLNETVTNAVISIPSCFKYSQRMAMRDAAKIAGFDESFIMNAPVAAAAAYGLAAGVASEKRILVFDLGGSCLGVTIVSITASAIETELQGCMAEASGEAFEQLVMEHVMKQLEKMAGKTAAEAVRKDHRARMRLRREAERAVRLLPLRDSVSIDVESLTDGEGSFSLTLSRSHFVDLTMNLVRLAGKLVNSLLKEAGIDRSDVAEVLLIGGASRILEAGPKMMQHLFPDRAPTVGILDPDRASVTGAAVRSGMLDGAAGFIKLTAVLTPCSQTIGYRIGQREGFVKMLGRNELIPAMNNRGDAIFGDPTAESRAEVHVLEEELAGHLSTAMARGSRYGLVGTISIAVPPTAKLDVWIVYRMRPADVLEVSIEGMIPGVNRSVVFDHRLSQKEMEQLRGRSQTLASRDRRLARRLKARDELELLAHSMKRQLHGRQGRLEATSEDDAGLISDLMKLASVATEEAVQWVEEAGTSPAAIDAAEFVRRRRELEAIQRKLEL